MLAKQSWQILRQLNSLLPKMFQGKYFKTENFLNVGLGHNPSYAWRSILRGRSLFEKGYRWNVGNIQLIQVSSNPWILGREIVDLFGCSTPSKAKCDVSFCR